jgi:hypothetical protein
LRALAGRIPDAVIADLLHRGTPQNALTDGCQLDNKYLTAIRKSSI